MTKWGCPRSPAATAQQIRFRTIGLMLFDRGHGICLSWWAFSGVVTIIDPQSSPRSYQKISFGEKRPLNGKLSKFRYESPARGFTYFCHGKAVLWPNRCVLRSKLIHHEKKVDILPPFLWLLQRSRRKFDRITFPIPYPCAKFVQIRPVFEEI